MASADETLVPFSFFVSLCREIRNIKPKPTSKGPSGSSEASVEPKSLKTFTRWVQELRRRFPNPPPQTTATLFLLLFPEEDARRRYGMKEASLAEELLDIFGISGKEGCRGAHLKRWSSPTSKFSSLGEQLYDLLSSSSASNSASTELSLLDVHTALDKLASKSQFSASSIRASADNSSKPRRTILRDIFLKLDPFEAATLTQIILKDLRPILYPTKNASCSESLLRFNSASVHMLTLQEAMRIWDPSNSLLRCYKVRSTIEDAARLFNEGNNVRSGALGPEIGVPIQIPKCFKAQGCYEALSKLRNSSSIWAETKYDGERMQIHVSANELGQSEITIFSKSRRDSTFDRIATHWIIREALGLDHDHRVESDAQTRTARRRDVLSSVILEAEMVAYDEEIGIDEFWRIRDLIETSATGARRRNKRDSDSALTGSESRRHLALVFFDILYLNGTPLLSEPYRARRATLEGIIESIPMYAYLAHRTEVAVFGSKGFDQGLDTLEHTFASSIVNREEGLVLKAAESTYADCRYPWVKLKKDYIPGLGDSVDLVLVGASWEQDRGRSLRVPTSTYTTFYVGAIDPQIKSAHSRLMVEVLFTVSYGLDRSRLEELNFLIKSSCTTNVDQLPFAFNIPVGLPKPQVFLSNPILVEVFGAGFTKTNETKNYELRFPRIAKNYRSNDRSWTEAITLSEYNGIALVAIGKVASELGERDGLQHTLESFGKDRRTLPGSRRKIVRPHTGEICGQQRRYQTSRVHKRGRTDENDHLLMGSDREKCSRQLTRWNDFQHDAATPFKSLTNWDPNRMLPHFAPRAGDPAYSDSINQPLESSGPNDYGGGGHPFAQFLRSAIIRLECCLRGCDTEFVNQHVLPRAVHSREAFEVGCGLKMVPTDRPEGFEFNYGVVFVDSRDWCESRPLWWGSREHETKHKTIFVYSSDQLRPEALHGERIESELDIQSKCLAVYV